MKKIIIAPDSFKGTLSGVTAARIIGEAAARTFENAQIIELPVADGGEGTLDCFDRALGGERITVEVAGPNFQRLAADFLLCGDTAIIETAQAAGLTRALTQSASKTTTYGVGELISQAKNRGATKFILGLGGSATNDCGCGMASALGTVFTKSSGESFVPVGESLHDVAKIEMCGCLDITALCDVDNPLCGAKGAAYVYAPQKGASPEEVKQLDSGLRHMQSLLLECGCDVSALPGAGAAGGMGAGVCAFLGGRLARGIDVLLDLTDFNTLAEDADMIITGEGSLDSQSFSGKVIDGILARSKKTPVTAIVGISKIENPADYGLKAVYETNYRHRPFEEIRQSAAEDLRLCAEKMFSDMKKSELA